MKDLPLLALMLLAGAQTPAAGSTSPSAPAASLQYRVVYYPIDLVSIDGRAVDGRQGKIGSPIHHRYEIEPGTHRLQFAVHSDPVPFDARSLHLDTIEFTAEAGKEYRVDFESAKYKETEGERTTLYYNFLSPVVLEKRSGEGFRAKVIGIPVAVAYATPVEPQVDPSRGMLLYEDRTLPDDATADIYCPRSRKSLAKNVFVERISGGSGETWVEFRRGEQPQRFRLLPGDYQVDVTLETGGWSIANVEAGVRTLSVKAEPGRTYRVHVNLDVGDTTFSHDAVGNNQMSTAFRWEAAFEDVTGMALDDE